VVPSQGVPAALVSWLAEGCCTCKSYAGPNVECLCGVHETEVIHVPAGVVVLGDRASAGVLRVCGVGAVAGWKPHVRTPRANEVRCRVAFGSLLFASEF